MTRTCEEETLSFISEWFDPHPQITKKFLLKYFPGTHEVEMTADGKKFLKRTKIPTTSPSNPKSINDFFVGATIILFSRDVKLIEYGDNSTKKLLDAALENSAIMFSSHIHDQVGKVLQQLENTGLLLVDLKGFFSDQDFFLKTSNISGFDPVPFTGGDTMLGLNIVVILRGKESLGKSLEIASLIKRNCDSKLTNGLVVAKNIDEVKIFSNVIRKENISCSPIGYCSLDKWSKKRSKYEEFHSCIIIKPHAIKSGISGAILDNITSRGYVIKSMQTFNLERIHAREFLEVYKGIVNEFNLIVDEMITGPVLALEVVGNFVKIRNDVGPWDIEMAKDLYPDSIRAKFGNTNIQNAVHCTDLLENSLIEISYFFDILTSA